MITIFILLFFVSILCAIWSLIRPSTFACRFWTSPTRKKLFFGFLSIGLIFFVSIGIFSPSKNENLQDSLLKVKNEEARILQLIEEKENKETERIKSNALRVEKEELERQAAVMDKKNAEKIAIEENKKKSIALAIKENFFSDKPKAEQKTIEPIYIDQLYGSDAKAIYSVMKSNSLLPDKDGSDKSKMAAILVSGYVFKDDDPCIEGKNPKKCLIYIKEAINSDKYKIELESFTARIKPMPDATDKERKDAAWQQGTRLCDELVLKSVTIPSTVDFALNGSFDAYTDGTFIKTGSFTHKNSYGQKLKKTYECQITMSKKGFNVTNAKIINLYEAR